MSKRIAFLTVIGAFLIFACTLFSPPETETPTPPAPAQAEPAATSTPGLAPADPTPSTTPAAPTNTPPPPPSPTPTTPPSPTPTAVSRVLGPENIGAASQLTSYFETLNEIYSDMLTNFTTTTFDLARNGSRVAYAVCGGNDSSFICNGDAQNDVVVLDALSGDLIRHLRLGTDRLADMALSPDGRTAYTLQTDLSSTRVQAWDVDSGEQVITVLQFRGRLDEYPRMCLSPDGSLIAASAGSLGLKVYSIADGQELFTNGGVFGRCRFSPDNQLLYAFNRNANGENYAVTVIDTASGQNIGQHVLDTPAINFFLSPDGKLAAFNHRDFATIRETGDWTLLKTLEPAPGEDWSVSGLAFSPDGRLFISLALFFSDDNYLHRGDFWATDSWEKIGELLGTSISTALVQFDESGESFVVFDWYFGGQRYGLPDDQLVRANQVFDAYMQSISSGDYSAAADLFTFDPLDLETPDRIRSEGGDPADMAAVFALACRPDAFPCLPVKEVQFAGRAEWSSYLFSVTFANPDGSTYTDADGYSDFWLYVLESEDGSLKVSSLHPGSFEP